MINPHIRKVFSLSKVPNLILPLLIVGDSTLSEIQESRMSSNNAIKACWFSGAVVDDFYYYYLEPLMDKKNKQTKHTYADTNATMN